MKKFLLSASVVLLFGLYVYSTTFNKNTQIPQQTPSPSQPADQSPPPPYGPAPIPTQTQTTQDQTAPAPTPAPTPTPAQTPVSTPAVRSGYKDGEYTGAVADAYFGNLQVKAVIRGGKLTDVQFLDFPKDRENSLQISNSSMPILKSEAIQAQSANVDIVSGATQTSVGFQQSLDSALSQAKA